MTLVLDSSVTLAWVFIDERTVATEAVLDLVLASGAWVPGIWHLETANVLEMAFRRNRLDPQGRDNALARLSALSIRVDDQTQLLAWSGILKLARQYRLTMYDAAYLELAQRRELPLATLDSDLRGAAAHLGVDLLGR